MAPRTTKRRRRTRSKAWIPASLTALVLLGGYFTADVYDIVPGPFTLTNDWPDPEPFPTPVLPEAPTPRGLALSDEAPTPVAEEVAELAAEFLADPATGPEPGVLITDALSGEILAEANADEAKIPASTTKLLTAVAALDAAGASYRFTTTVVAGDRSDPEALTVVAGGDLTLDEGMGDPGAVIGRGGIEALASQTADNLTATQRTSVSDIVIDESLWEGERLAPRWDDQDLDEGWIIPLAPIAIDLGRVEGQMPRSQTPATDVGHVFKDALEDRGIEVTGTVRTGEGPEGGEALARVESATLAELAEYMLVYSDNVLAESLGRLAAVESGMIGSFDGAEEAVRTRLETLGVSVEGLRLADTSGLSSVNKISPRTLVEALGAASTDHPELLATVRGLPIAGLEGTLRNRMRETAAAGTVVAKTGSLRFAATIAGQVHTAEGRLLHVAIMTADWDSSLAQARGAIDRLLVGLAECGCTGQ